MPMIHSTWHTSFWKRSAHKYLTRATYDEGQDRRIDRLVRSSHVLVAFFPEVPEEILGWACLKDDVLHYTYVKSLYRGRGIAAGLVGDRVKFYTHAADKVGERFLAKVGAVFNPYLLELL